MQEVKVKSEEIFKKNFPNCVRLSMQPASLAVWKKILSTTGIQRNFLQPLKMNEVGARS